MLAALGSGPLDVEKIATATALEPATFGDDSANSELPASCSSTAAAVDPPPTSCFVVVDVVMGKQTSTHHVKTETPAHQGVSLERKTGFEPATLTLANRWSSIRSVGLTSVYAGQRRRMPSSLYLSRPRNAGPIPLKWHESSTTDMCTYFMHRF